MSWVGCAGVPAISPSSWCSGTRACGGNPWPRSGSDTSTLRGVCATSARKAGDRATFPCPHLETYGINDAGQVHSYLIYLSRLPYNEQLYWQSFNEAPKAPISETTYRREFLGEFVADENPLRSLKNELRELGEKAPGLWKCKEERLFETVHLPVTSSEREWSGEILELAKLMVEGLEAVYLRRKAVEAGVVEIEKLGSIALIEAILRSRGWEDDAVGSIVAPLREVQMLRTKLRGHASGPGTRSIVAEVVKRHGSYVAHFRWLTSESQASVRRLIECAERGVL